MVKTSEGASFYMWKIREKVYKKPGTKSEKLVNRQL